MNTALTISLCSIPCTVRASAKQPQNKCWLISRKYAHSNTSHESYNSDADFFGQVFPDISFKLLSPFPLIAENEFVVARWFGGGKHTGQPLFDLPIGDLPQPNSGKEMRFSGTTIFTLKDGKIVDEVGEESSLAALQQLGLI